jgi:HEAT repeat protein
MARRAHRVSGKLTMLLAIAATSAWLSACAGPPRRAVLDAIDARTPKRALRAYETLRRDDGPDVALLGRIAVLILERGARSDAPSTRDAALAQLTLAGREGLPVLEKLAASRAPLPVRARALAALAPRDADARARLAQLRAHPDPAIAALAVGVLEPEADRADLDAALAAPAAPLRAAAASALSAAAPDTQARHDLAMVARVDPDPTVRAAATRALGAFGPEASEALRERLSDADLGVRRAATLALAQADRPTAERILAPLLGLPAAPHGIDAARVLAASPTLETARDAGAYLLGALASGDASVRSAAAIALLSLPRSPARAEAVADAMTRETAPDVRLLLACNLTQRVTDAAEGSPAARARAVLEALRTGGGMHGIQAAAQLASLGDRDAARGLRRALRGEDVAIRRVAARALARDALAPDAARVALRDRDEGVRIAAAGGILAALSTL